VTGSVLLSACLVLSYYNLKQYDSCINTFKLLEDSKTTGETSYYYTAMSYKALGKQAIAISYFEKAIKEAISENVNSYYGEMGDSYDRLHQAKSAVNAYQKSLLYGVMPLNILCTGQFVRYGTKEQAPCATLL